MKTSSLTHRQRFRIAVDRKEPDRVPFELGGSTSMMNDPLYFKVKDLLGVNREIQPYRAGKASNYYDEEVWERLGSDFRHVWLGSPDNFQVQVDEQGKYIDEWGIARKTKGNGAGEIFAPLGDADLDGLNNYRWPDPYDKGRIRGLKERARWLHEHTDYVVSAKYPVTDPLLGLGMELRGSKFFIDLLANKRFANALLDKITQVIYGLYESIMEEAGSFLDMVEIADDFARQSAPLISGHLYREMFMPRYREIVNMIKKKAPGVKVFFHSCGAIYTLIPWFIETGYDIINPLQPNCRGTDHQKIKHEFGSEVCFHGAIDVQAAMLGSEEDVKREVRRRIDALAPGGGYILSTANQLQQDTPPENVICLSRYAREYGCYRQSM